MPARRRESWRGARTSFLTKLGVTLAVTLLVLVKVAEVGAASTPGLVRWAVFVVAASVAVTWAREEHLSARQKEAIQTLMVLLQVALFLNHFGVAKTLLMSLVSVAVIWRRFAPHAWRLLRSAGPSARLPLAPALGEQVRRGTEVAVARVRRARRFLHGKS